MELWAKISRVSDFRASIRVRPSARRDAVVGRAATSRPGQPDILEVHVRARPVGGAATAAAERVLAEALGLRRGQVRVILGTTSRTKRVRVSQPPADLAGRWARLLERPDPRG